MTMTVHNSLQSPPGQELMSINEVPNGGLDPNNAKQGQENTNQQVSNADIPPPKTDKPRPHTCTTCARAFARLEHLKRHERSHTKEKPFECPECTRCFARRDLLLRHQQKLHMTTTPSSRPRARRESTSAAGPTRVRKNSMAHSGGNSARPRANTISHVDGAKVGMMASTGSSARAPQTNHAHHPSLGSMQTFHGLDQFRGLSSEGPHNPFHSLSKLDTSGLPLDTSSGLRTAPPFGTYNSEFGFPDVMTNDGTTINPAQLHFPGSPNGYGHEFPSPFGQNFPGVNQNMLEDDLNYDWVHGFDSTMTFANANESAVDGSSPSAMSTGSQSGISEAMMDGPNQAPTSTAGMWTNPQFAQSQVPSNQFSLDFASSFPDLGPQAETVSPKSLLAQSQFSDAAYSTTAAMGSMNSSVLSGVPHHMFHPPTVTNGDAAGTAGGFLRPANFAPIAAASTAADSITDSTREALVTALQQPSGLNNRHFSQPSNSPISPTGSQSRSNSYGTLNYNFPSTADFKRYISAYINYFHPHMPFLHVPTLDFNAPEYASRLRTHGGHSSHASSGVTGGGCLILSMAAIGSLYEFETAISKELFESAKRMIQLYLEERRRADMSAAINRSNCSRDNSAQNTPLWLVQAMLLNVIYGHNGGDKTSADIANTHCAALVSLARAAGLLSPLSVDDFTLEQLGYSLPKADAELNGANGDMWNGSNAGLGDEKRNWFKWKIAEERKRTLYTIFTLSSLLVSAYNHAPAIINSEIELELPCEERLWYAESPQAWKALGGSLDQKGILFSHALAKLLTASKRSSASPQRAQPGHGVSVDDLTQSDLKPSTFGCLVLIHALHNYIWDTRERHLTQPWTIHEIEVMHAKIEPALRAWQAAWGSNPCHSLERPNPYGLGPLSADSIPLLDLAYVRLFVNLGRSKEAFWQRDWNAMADELARGTTEPLQSSNNSPGSEFPASKQSNSDQSPPVHMVDPNHAQNLSNGQPVPASSRERLLRKAAFYAADSISMSDKLGNTYAEFTSRELPIQSAMCAFDCAQVLAEWITAVQERVGPYLGILGQDTINLNQGPAMLLLEDEDFKLMQKMEEILRVAEQKMQVAYPVPDHSGNEASNCLPSSVEGGYGIKILFSAAYLLDRAAVWPVTHLMARSLETQGRKIKERAQQSLMGHDIFRQT